MDTYQMIRIGGKEFQLANVIRRAVLAALFLFVLLAVSGCKRPEDTPVPTPTEGLPQPTGEASPEPTKPEGTQAPAATKAPEVTRVPLKESDFPVVTPMPQDTVADVKGTLTKDTFPRVDGSTATIPLSEALYQYATGASAEEAAQAIKHTKTTNSYKRLYNKEVDLLIVYEPSEEIVERMKTEQLLVKPIGLDALVFMANAKNPVESLTMEQLVSIYSGKIKGWAEVGGEDKELLAFQRPLGSGSQTLMQKLVMGDTAMADGANVFRYSTMGDILEGMLSYNGEDNTLGYSVFYYANNMYSFPELKFMGVDGVLPSTQTIYDGSYALTNSFYAVIRPEEPENSAAHQLFDWLTGKEGQKMILDLGYVPVIMPEGGQLAAGNGAKNSSVEVTPHGSLSEGEHYVFFVPQNAESEYLYGDATVYDKDWNVSAKFYNIAQPLSGLYKNRYLPIGQIRMNADGEQKVVYGIYDLEAGTYSVTPQYPDLVVLDQEREYYAVVAPDPQNELYYTKYNIINGLGECILEGVRMEDWLTISKQGNGYLEYCWDYENDPSLTVFFYDENLRLDKAYYTVPEKMPSEAERIEGAEYYLVGKNGCLIDENGEMLINEETFLSKYGNGTDTECVLPFYNLTMADTEGSYGVEYAGEIYIVDRDLSLLRKVAKKSLPNVFQVDYHRDFYSGYDAIAGKTLYYSYDDAELTMQDGTLIDGIERNWGDDAYLLYKNYEDRLVAEEHIPNKQQVNRYEYPLSKDMAGKTTMQYVGNGYLILINDTGKQIPSPYQADTEEPHMLSVNCIALYKGERKLMEKEGLWANTQKLEDGNLALTITSGTCLKLETESMIEPFVTQDLSYYFIVGEDGILFAQETPAYLHVNSDGFLQFDIGNYTYVFDYEGKQYIKALNHFLGMD